MYEKRQYLMALPHDLHDTVDVTVGMEKKEELACTVQGKAIH